MKDSWTGLMCKDCSAQCTKAEELIDCFIVTMEMKGFIDELPNGLAKDVLNSKIYNCLGVKPYIKKHHRSLDDILGTDL